MGAQSGELAALTAADMDLDTSSIYIRPSKSGKERHIPLNTEGARFFKKASMRKKRGETLLSERDGMALGKNRHVRLLAEACKAARVEPAIGFHELRHNYNSTLAQCGVDLLTISKLLGHADTRITSRHYAYLADQTLRDAVAKPPGFAREPESNVVGIN